MTRYRKSDIAIVGMAFRLPGDISTTDELWSALQQSKNLITNVDDSRFPFKSYLHPRRSEPGKSYTFNAGILSKIDEFDAAFFGISPREARQMDPQQRILLETTWEALENGSQNIEQLAGANCAVYIGIGSNEHVFNLVNDNSAIDSYTMLGNCSSIASNRISYVFDFHGPSMSIDTACSSSLVALHQACSSIWNGEASMAIAGGVNMLLSPTGFVGFSKASMLSPEGQCKSFAAEGNGYVRSEGCVVVFLKPLAEAERDGDPIHALILNSGVNSDGHTSGITLPSSDSQAALINRVHEQINIPVNDISYIEAHGTGTIVGDRAETLALGASLAKKRANDNPLLIGSIKSNLGHLEVASGLTGVLKTILCIQQKVIPPSLHFTNPNPDINFNELNLKVVDTAVELPKQNKPVIMAVNSFGFGGTNAHVILAEYVRKTKENSAVLSPRDLPPLLLSTHDETTCPVIAEQYLHYINNNPADYYDIAYTLSHRRTLHNHGMVIYGEDLQSIIKALEQLKEGTIAPQVISEQRLGKNLSIALVYSGNGAIWQGMASQLIQTEPLFIETIDEIDALFAQHSGISIKAELLASRETNRFDNTEIAQPCIFALQVAITRYLLKHGVQVSAVTGHSVGEIAAAWASGALTLKQATEVIYKRSFWQGKTRGKGRMMAIGLSAKDAEDLIQSNKVNHLVEIAAINSLQGVTLAGDLKALEVLQAICSEKGIFNRLLDLDYAFHTHNMDSIRDGLLKSLAALKPKQSKIRFISTVTGSELSGKALNADYWWRNIRQPVKFNDAINTLLDDGTPIFIEVGPHPILKPYLEASLRTRDIKGLAIQTFARNKDQVLDLKRAIYRTWLSGAKFDKSFFFPKLGNTTILPAYPLKRESHWITPTAESSNPIELKIEHPLLGHRIKSGESIWENHLDTVLLPYLADHVVDGVAVMPAAGYAEMAMAASKCWYKNDYHDLRDIEILVPMVFDEKSCRRLRFELRAEDGHFLIKSRPRHVEEPWVIHVVGRLIPEPATGSIHPKIDIGLQQSQAKLSFNGPKLYEGARAVGLVYGPMFQSIAQVWMKENTALASTHFTQSMLTEMQSHCLYPGLLDACFQLLISLISHNNAVQDTYLPIRLGRLQLLRAMPDEIYLTAQILVKSKQSVLANFTIVDKAGEIVAIINQCRFKKAHITAEASTMKMYACKPYLLKPSDAKNALDFASLQLIQAELSSTENTISNHFESVMPLIDLMVSHFIYQAIIGLSSGQASFSLASFSTKANIAEAYRPFLEWCLNILVQDSLLQKQDDGQYIIMQQNEDIDAQSVWHMLLNHYPNYLTELLLIGRVGLHLQDLLRGKISATELLYSLRKNDALKHFYEDSPSVAGIHDVVYRSVAAILDKWPVDRRIRVLDVGYSLGSLTMRLINLLPADKTDYQLVVADEGVQKHIDGHNYINVSILPSNQQITEITGQQFDVILIRNYLHETEDVNLSLAHLQTLLASDGVLLLTEKYTDRLHEFTLGSQPDWWLQSKDKKPLSRLCSTKIWQQRLTKAGFQSTEPLFENGVSGAEGSFLFLAQSLAGKSNATTVEALQQDETILVLAKSKKTVGPLFAALKTKPGSAMLITDADFSEAGLQQLLKPYVSQQHKVHIVWVFDKNVAIQQGAADCTAIINLVKAIQETTWAITPQLTLVTREALPAVIDDKGTRYNPVHATVWGVGRVLSNEYADLKCKLIDLQGELSQELAAIFAQEIVTQDNEAEIIITHAARYGLRVDITELATQHYMLDYRLDFKRAGSLNNLHWFPIPQSSLAVDDVLIRPHASGLNFRDVMYAMGLIPDEAVEDGFLGASLGMEFAGEVLAVGDAVTSFAVGDKVMGFAPASFSSSTITKVHAITALPKQWSYPAAATVPIAFFTAYYAIHHLAHLQAGERILIHGAAGGVGIAAIQVAKHFGAEIYTTAGSPEKRDFLKLMGISHIYDSRSLLFADEIMADTAEEGVDIVLNCLAGEAINANLAIMKPFGRFLELGKRDFFANSKVGLRPFRNNISYFGIDADQLLMKQPALCICLFKEIMALFEQEVLTPLPFREFRSQNISDTFRYMQQSRHIGKIVVNLEERPHSNFALQNPSTSLSLSTEGSYLVTGGLSGFGLQTAQWLVDKGARQLILVNRSGITTDEAKQAIAAFKQNGVKVSVNALDISDAAAVKTMIDSIRTSSAPLKGIIHAAAVYDDALIQNLNFERINTVLAPKVEGAWNLHCSTVDIPLDFFVVYSSVTTLFGNPGQANYVAANCYLESLILYRRSLGLTGIFAAWGPITDVGYLARNEKLKNLLAAKMGNQVLTSRQALQFLEKLMLSNSAGIAIANLNISKMQRSLAALASSKFDNLVAYDKHFGEFTSEQPDDIRALLVDKPAHEAFVIVSQILTSEIAKILRLPMEKIDQKASLLNIGMDSLVGAELANAIQERFTIQIPMLALSQGLSVHMIAERIMGQLFNEENTTAELQTDITRVLHEASLHGEEISRETALELVSELQETAGILD